LAFEVHCNVKSRLVEFEDDLQVSLLASVSCFSQPEEIILDFTDSYQHTFCLKALLFIEVFAENVLEAFDILVDLFFRIYYNAVSL